MKDKIDKVLNKIRPMISRDGGGLELIDFDGLNGVVKVKMTGACRGCPMANITLKAGIEALLLQEVPEVKEVIAVQ